MWKGDDLVECALFISSKAAVSCFVCDILEILLALAERGGISSLVVVDFAAETTDPSVWRYSCELLFLFCN